MISPRRIVAAALSGAVLAGAAVAPAAAYEVKGTGFHARFLGGQQDGTGMIVADRTGGGNPRIHVTFVGLLPYIEQSNVYRSIGCGGTPKAANRVFRTTGAANSKGELRYNRALSSAIDFDRVRSIWSTVGDSTECVPVVHFVRVATGDVNGDGAAGIIDGTSNTIMLLLEQRPDSTAQLSVVIFGRDGDDQISLRASSIRCGRAPTAASIKLSDVLVSSYHVGIYDINISELVSLRSMRVKNLDTGQTWCAPLSIIAILIG